MKDIATGIKFAHLGSNLIAENVISFQIVAINGPYVPPNLLDVVWKCYKWLCVCVFILFIDLFCPPNEITNANDHIDSWIPFAHQTQHKEIKTDVRNWSCVLKFDGKVILSVHPCSLNTKLPGIFVQLRNVQSFFAPIQFSFTCSCCSKMFSSVFLCF